MTVVELRRLQRMLLEEIEDARIVKVAVPEPKDGPVGTVVADAPPVVTLLAAVAVAIAWWTYRGKAAPAPNIQRVFDCVADGHSYLLPIPRSQPCFCGLGIQFKNCHGRPPHATPLMGPKLTVVGVAG